MVTGDSVEKINIRKIKPFKVNQWKNDPVLLNSLPGGVCDEGRVACASAPCSPTRHVPNLLTPISMGQLSVNQSFVGKSSCGQHNRSYLTIFALIFGGVCMLRFSHVLFLRACNFWNIVSYFIVKIFNIVTVVRGQGVETKKEIWLTMASIKKKWKNVPMSLLHHKARWGHVSPGCGVWRVTVRRPRQWQYRSGASHYLTRHQPSISDYISHSHKYLVVMVDMVFQHLSAYVDYVDCRVSGGGA